MGKAYKDERDTAKQETATGISLAHRLLVAMPALGDVFAKSVIYVCAHSDDGAMGIVVNQRLPNVVFDDLVEQLDLPRTQIVSWPVVHFGGPVDMGRGFVLHSGDYCRADTVQIRDNICMTGTVDILQAMAEGRGPANSIFALGYAGWGPGQLEEELQNNLWLDLPADPELIFSGDTARKWEDALTRAGIVPAHLSAHAGHA